MFNRTGMFFVILISIVVGTPSAFAEQAAPVAEVAGPALVEPSKIRIGPLLGLNASTIICDSCEASGVTGRLGVAVGGVFEFVIVDKFSIEFETMYLQKGARIAVGNITTGYINYNTIEVPISAKGRFGNDKVKGIVFGGTQIGFALARSTQASGATTTVHLDANTIDFGLHIGGGAEFKVGNEVYIFVNGRINVGLTDVQRQITNEKSSTFGVLGTSGVKFGL